MNIIEQTISSAQVGNPTSFRNLTICPIFGPSIPKDYFTLDEALAKGVSQVTEISEQGRVPELRFINEAETPVLLLDGEELIGAKQNRILNISVLVPARCSLNIPVSCVEAGRWTSRSRQFRTSPRAHHASGRRMKLRDVSVSMARTGERNSDQSAVWSDIGRKMERLHVASSTSAMSDMFEQEGSAIEHFVCAFQPAPNQVGAGFLIGGQVVGLEIFDNPNAFQSLFPKLIRSYALDAIDYATQPLPPAGTAKTNGIALSDFMRAVATADCEAFKAVGEGEDLRISNTDICGAALLARDRIVHLAAFAQ